MTSSVRQDTPVAASSPAGKTTGNPERVHFRKGKTNPRRIAYLTLLLFARPPGALFLAVGFVLVSLAVLVHGWAAGYLARAGYTEREKVLTVRGPYRYNRNPYYAAHLTMDLGFFFLSGWPLFYLLYLPVILSVYRRWVVKEEKFLEEEFGEDYRVFKGEVPRWLFRLTPAPARGREQTFQWATFMLNREWERAVPHLALLIAFSAYYVFENPFGGIEWPVRATVIAVWAGWLALHDIYPIDVSRKSAAWVAAALAVSAGTAVLLSRAPVWEPWGGVGAGISVAAGLVLGLIVSATALPAVYAMTGKKSEDFFARPMSQWYTMGLGLGLISCTLGGIWVGIIIPVILWALGLSGWIPVTRMPKHGAVGTGLILLFLFSGGWSVSRWWS